MNLATPDQLDRRLTLLDNRLQKLVDRTQQLAEQTHSLTDRLRAVERTKATGRAAPAQPDAQVEALRRQVDSLAAQLAALKRSPKAAAAKGEGVIAKASYLKHADSKGGLMARAESVFHDPARIGVLASQIQGGQLDEARRAIEKAEFAAYLHKAR
jgi:phage I-like protein